MNYRFYNANIYLPNEIIKGEVWVENNIIKYVGEPKKSNITFDREIDVENNLLMPGLIDMHAHCGMTYIRGGCDDATLEDWLYDYVMPIEANMTYEDYYWSNLQTLKEFVRGGVTCCLDMYFDMKARYDSFVKSGFRYCATSGYKNFENDFSTYKQSDMFKIFIDLHSVYTTDEEEIKEVVRLSRKYNTRITVHTSETLTEVGECQTKHNMTPIAYLNDFGFFSQPTICAHCVFLDDSDIEIIKENNITVASNPASNLKLGSGIANLYNLQKQGVNITLGTDSAGSNNRLDMFNEMYLASVLQKGNLHETTALSSNSVVKMATINSAKALGYDNLGEIKEGYLADLILLNIKEPNYQPWNNLRQSLIYSVNSKDVYLTMVNGKILYENGVYYLSEDADKITENFIRCNEKLLNIKK